MNELIGRLILLKFQKLLYAMQNKMFAIVTSFSFFAEEKEYAYLMMSEILTFTKRAQKL